VGPLSESRDRQLESGMWQDGASKVVAPACVG
jgi:hypothetical protein